MMDADKIRAIYYRQRERCKGISTTADREIAMAQLEVLCELTAQLAEIHSIVVKVGLINFEELALRLDDFFKKTQD